MGSGGARNRSGPQTDPTSGRSDRRGYTLTALPSEGYQGDVPGFPLQPIVLFNEYFDGLGKDRVKVKERDDGETESFRERETDVWNEAWSTPQACAWSMQSWRWPIIGEYCRLKTVIEFDPAASAALVGQLHRYRDQIGLTPAGLKDNGWAIAVDEVAAKAASKSSGGSARPESQSSSRSRMAMVKTNGA
ncbi:hypothetical protein [Aeromicrobium sp. UC242_57]|uniref:hypothetical protein n=1 Tax=Aeromicrobium sp. UC242_57 TaxID=3374624 RepID=UPI00378EB40B